MRKKMTGNSAKMAHFQVRLGVGDDVRTSRSKIARLAVKIWRDLRDEDGQRILQNIRLLRERFEPELVAKKKVSRPQSSKTKEAP
jgi:hypothetical protein